MRRFILERQEDVNGTSGTGIVAEGCEFENGWVAFTWLSPYSMVTTAPSIHNIKHVHGHNGKTKVVWIDPPTENDVDEVKKEEKAAVVAKKTTKSNGKKESKQNDQ